MGEISSTDMRFFANGLGEAGSGTSAAGSGAAGSGTAGFCTAGSGAAGSGTTGSGTGAAGPTMAALVAAGSACGLDCIRFSAARKSSSEKTVLFNGHIPAERKPLTLF